MPKQNKGHKWQATASIIINGEKLKTFPVRSGGSQRCPLLTLSLNILLKVLVMAIREKKNSHWKEGVKLSLSADDKVPYIENLKDA